MARKDPTHTKWIITDAELAALEILANLRRDLLDIVSKTNFTFKAAEYFADPGDDVDLNDLISKFLGKKNTAAEETKKVVENQIPKAYTAGDTFGSIQLGLPYEQRSEHWKKIGDLITNANSIVGGAYDDFHNKCAQILSDGILNERKFADIVDALENQVGVTTNRAITIMQTEIMRAVNKGVVDRYKNADIEEVEWITVADDPWPCDQCAPLDGQIFPINELPDLPLHPRCRCTVVPVLPKQDTSGDVIHELPNLDELDPDMEWSGLDTEWYESLGYSKDEAYSLVAYKGSYSEAIHNSNIAGAPNAMSQEIYAALERSRTNYAGALYHGAKQIEIDDIMQCEVGQTFKNRTYYSSTRNLDKARGFARAGVIEIKHKPTDRSFYYHDPQYEDEILLQRDVEYVVLKKGKLDNRPYVVITTV